MQCEGAETAALACLADLPQIAGVAVVAVSITGYVGMQWWEAGSGNLQQLLQPRRQGWDAARIAQARLHSKDGTGDALPACISSLPDCTLLLD